MNEVIEIDTPVSPQTQEEALPPVFGYCPYCSNPLHPRRVDTGEPAYPQVGAGDWSRARCDKCGRVIEYVGRGEWVVYCNKFHPLGEGCGH